MNLFELTKDLSEAASKHCELVNGIRIMTSGQRYVQHENPKEDYFEQDVVVHFTRKVKQDSHEFGYLVDNIGVRESWASDEKDEYLHRMYDVGITSTNKQKNDCDELAPYEDTFLNCRTYNAFKDRMIRYFNEESLTIVGSGMVRVPMSKIRDEIKEDIPVAGMMLPLDLFYFVCKMFNNMDWFCLDNYKLGFEESSFIFQISDLKEYGIKNPCLDKISE